MKIKKYEKTTAIIIICLIIFIIEGFFIWYLESNKMFVYTKIQAIALDKQTIYFVISKTDKQNIQKGNYVYIDTKKNKYKLIQEDKTKIRNKEYYELTIQLESKIKYQEKDVVEVTIPTEKKKLIEIFHTIKDGG